MDDKNLTKMTNEQLVAIIAEQSEKLKDKETGGNALTTNGKNCKYLVSKLCRHIPVRAPTVDDTITFYKKTIERTICRQVFANCNFTYNSKEDGKVLVKPGDAGGYVVGKSLAEIEDLLSNDPKNSDWVPEGVVRFNKDKKVGEFKVELLRDYGFLNRKKSRVGG